MRLTTVILIASLMQVSAATFGQRITINQNDAPLTSIFKEIRKQSGYDFYYNSKDIPKTQTVTIAITNASLEDALKIALKGSSLNYEIDGKIITIKKKEESFIDRIVARFQAIDVRGRVVDEKGQALPGATVRVKGSGKIVMTNSRGEFYIADVKEEEVLVFTYTGYLMKEVNANGDLSAVMLEVSNSKLDEVQIMAYGTTSQRLNTGNIVSIKAADIEKQPVNNPLYALQGRVAGLEITPITGISGGAVNIQIRGKNSLTRDSDPLVVVDGLPVINNIPGFNHPAFQTSNGNKFSALSFINPNDIESIDVLKDADATSIYGSRGANGVILITTKKGKVGQTKIDFNFQLGKAEVSRKMKLMNTSQYLEIRKEAFTNSGQNITTIAPSLSTADVKVWDQNRYTDWQEELLGKSAMFNDFQGSISGGSPLIQYIIGGNYHKETTVFAGDNSDQKGGGHLSLTGISPNQMFRSTVNITYQSDFNTLPGIDLTDQAMRLAPNAPSIYKSDGSLNWEPLPNGNRSWNNPYANLYQTYEAKMNNLTASSDIGYDLFKYLNVKVQMSYNELSGNSFRKAYPFLGRPPEEESVEIGEAIFNNNSVRNLSIEPQISYKLSIGKGNLDLLLGGSYQNSTTKTEEIDAVGATSDALLGNWAASDPQLSSIRNTSSEYKYMAVFSRASYNFDNRYLLNLSLRRDGSSRFGPGNQFGNFYSVGAAWIFSNEQFLKSLLPIISYGKLRGSYGTSGNDGIGDYQYLERYQPISVTDLYQGMHGYRTAGLFNSYYAWEVTKKLELGLETGYFNDRFLLNFSYYRNRSSNQLLGIPYATMAGPGTPVVNLPALIQNAGIELILTTQNIKSRVFSWTTNFNFTRNRNKLISYPNLDNSVDYTSILGRPFYGEVSVTKFADVDPETGKYRFVTAAGDFTFNPSDPSRTDFGSYLRIFTAPKFYGGLTNTFTYKNFSLDVFVQYTKQNGVNPLRSYITSAGALINLPVEFLNRWQKAGDNAAIQKIYRTKPTDFTGAANNLLTSDFNYVDASFIRLKNFSLSYRLEDKWLQKLKLQTVRVFAQGQNLFTVTNYKGLDPETQSLSSLPPIRVVTAGLQLTF